MMAKKKGVFDLVPWKWVTCDECEGKGMVRAPNWIQGMIKQWECDECDGKGKKKVAWVFTDEDESFLR